MAKTRRHPRLIPSRYTDEEYALVEAAARVEGKTLQDYLRGVVLPAVSSTLHKAQETVLGGRASSERAA